MDNRDLAAAWTYHNGTKHSFWSIRRNAHFLDWPNKPLPFKIYSSLAPIELPRETQPLDLPALEAVSSPGPDLIGDKLPDLNLLVQMLYYSAGITKVKLVPGGEILFRAASCTGALYEIELYLVCSDLPGLSSGVYHFNPQDMSLRQLRAGDYRGTMLRATGHEPAIADAPITIICTGTYWRNAWKYQARTYRHFGWDNGTILANLLASSVALELPARVVMGFVDEDVNRLLGLDLDREVAFSLVALGRTSTPPPEPPLEIEPIRYETLPLSASEVDYPAMRAMHQASSLVTEAEVHNWRVSTPQELPEASGELIPLKPLPNGETSSAGLGTVILKRGSTRRFARGDAISFEQFSAWLLSSVGPIPADFLEPTGAYLNEIYLIVHAVDGLRPGAYFFQRQSQSLELLKEGSFRDDAGYLGLEQALPSDASATAFLIADLHSVLACYGNRGYRAVQLEAGIIGGKMYLSAYGQGFGATGLTFYDDDVINFFFPHAEGKSTIFHVAIGKSAKRRLGQMQIG
jgi:SagB-type dehydrogenase family enzyme